MIGKLKNVTNFNIFNLANSKFLLTFAPSKLINDKPLWKTKNL